MYQGSAAFQTANAQAIQKHRITGYIDTIPFTAKNILSGSLTITNQCSDNTDVKIGAVYIGKLTVTFLNNLTVPVSTWKNRKIVVNFGLCIDETTDPETWEDFKLGEYFVSKADITPDGVVITAYDAMAKFDRKLPEEFLASGQAADILRALCNTCGVTFGMTDLEVATLPNGTRPLGLYTPNDCTTYRDILYWLSATLGGFATINRAGVLVVRSYYNIENTDAEIDDTRRITGASFSDFATDFGSAVFDNVDGTQQRIGSQGVGATYFAGFNPFAQYGTIEAKNIIRTNIFLSIQTIKYTPFKVQILSSPVFELGDVVEFSGGIINGNDKKGVVMSMTYQASKGITLQGFGADPALQDVETASEKANSAAARAQQNSEVIYKDFTNITTLSVEDGADPTKVVEINFSTNKETDVEMWHEFLISTDTSADMTVTAVYYMDGVELARKPVETYGDSNKHILDLHYFKHIAEVGTHKWEVFLETSGGDLTIAELGAVAVLKGQGISKVDAWTGVIVIDDEISAPDMGMTFGSLTTAAVVSVHALDHLIEVTDTITPFSMGMLSFGILTDAIDIIFHLETFAIVSEDEDYNIVSEDGDYNIVSE